MKSNFKRRTTILLSLLALLGYPSYAQAQTDYPLQFSSTVLVTHATNWLSRVTLNGKGATAFPVSNTPKLVYHQLSGVEAYAMPGDTISPVFSYLGGAMHGYVYMDWARDGQFSCNIDTVGTKTAAGSDLVSFSAFSLDGTNWFKSDGTATTEKDWAEGVTEAVDHALPAFTIPAGQGKGIYRMRFKVDYNRLEAAGGDSAAMASKGGAVMDVDINVHGDSSAVKASSEGGTITIAGAPADGQLVPFGKDLKVVVKPATTGKVTAGLMVKHGYLDQDTLIHGVAQWKTNAIYAPSDTITIPANMINGDVSLSGIFVDDYYVSVDKTTKLTRTDRYLTGASYTGTKGGKLSVTVPTSPNLLYHYVNMPVGTAVPGESIMPIIKFKGSSMCGNIYIDYNRDGRFAPVLRGDTAAAEGSEAVSYSSYKGYNSLGVKANPWPWYNISSGAKSYTLPMFTIPEGLTPGYYLARFQVDYNGMQPEGKSSILKNGGGMIDVRINIHDTASIVNASFTGGTVYIGSETVGDTKVAFGQPLTINIKPAPGKLTAGAIIKHGYNLSGDSLLHGVAQWSVDTVKATSDTIIIPATLMDGDLFITGMFIKEDYAVNFDKTSLITRSGNDRCLAGASFIGNKGGALSATAPTSPLFAYHKVKAEGSAAPGETVTPVILYKGSSMCGDIFIDYNHDGQFTPTLRGDTAAAEGSEVVSYSSYRGYNSLGTKANPWSWYNISSGPKSYTLPAFTIPADQKFGIYPMRFNVDYNSVDPGGRSDLIKNGGGILDVTINIHDSICTVNNATGDGTILLGDTAIHDTKVAFGKPLAITLQPKVGKYVIGIIVKHGYLDGDSLIHGIPQWSIDTIKAAVKQITIPATMMNGDVLITSLYGEAYYTSFDKAIANPLAPGKAITLVSLDKSAHDAQFQYVLSDTEKALSYNRITTATAYAVPGDTIHPHIVYPGNGIHSSLFIDYNHSGSFEPSLGSNGLPADSSETVAFEYFHGMSSDSVAVPDPDAVNAYSMPAFVLYKNAKPGIYMMRFKADKQSIDPIGSDHLVSDGGGIVDVPVNIHRTTSKVTVNATGVQFTSNGSDVNGQEVPFMKDLKLAVKKDANYLKSPIIVKHGYFTGDSIIFDIAQWKVDTIPAAEIQNFVTIPARMLDGDVELTTTFTEAYAISYPKDQAVTHASRRFNGIYFYANENDSLNVTFNDNTKAYQGLYNDAIGYAMPGDTVYPAIDFTGAWMHGYVYIDYGHDGTFDPVMDEKLPAAGSDLVSFSCYNNVNSIGEAQSGTPYPYYTPKFVIPATTPAGFYLMRYKVDYNSIDPAGRNDGNNSIIHNGGGVADVVINIHKAKSAVTVIADHGTLSASGTALNTGSEVAFGKGLAVTIAPAKGFLQDGLIIKHGYFSGDSVIYGVKQWRVDTIAAASVINNAATIPASMIDGDIQITALFKIDTKVNSANANNGLSITSRNGIVTIKTSAPTHVSIIDNAGISTYSGTVDGSYQIRLRPHVVYVINGHKVMMK